MTQLATSPVAESGYERMSYEEFLALPSDVHAEWVDGEVILMPSASRLHSALGAWLIALFGAYVGDHPVARIFYEPFQMRTAARPSGRAPDVMLLLNEHADRLQELYIEGAADLVIEVASPSNAATDYVDKLREYEAAGVPEYWIIDPQNSVADFFVLSAEGRYERTLPGADGIHRCTVLPEFWLRVSWLWERPAIRGVLAQIEAGAPV